MLSKKKFDIRNISFIHFGNSTICNDISYDTKKDFSNKPINSLWASPYRDNGLYKSDWEEYCLANNMKDRVSDFTLFRLKSNSRILIIDSLKDLKLIDNKYIYKDLISDSKVTKSIFNIDNLIRDFDGVFISKNGLEECKNIFYEWETESLSLFRANTIVRLTKEAI